MQAIWSPKNIKKTTYKITINVKIAIAARFASLLPQKENTKNFR